MDPQDCLDELCPAPMKPYCASVAISRVGLSQVVGCLRQAKRKIMIDTIMQSVIQLFDTVRLDSHLRHNVIRDCPVCKDRIAPRHRSVAGRHSNCRHGRCRHVPKFKRHQDQRSRGQKSRIPNRAFIHKPNRNPHTHMPLDPMIRTKRVPKTVRRARLRLLHRLYNLLEAQPGTETRRGCVLRRTVDSWVYKRRRRRGLLYMSDCGFRLSHTPCVCPFVVLDLCAENRWGQRRLWIIRRQRHVV